tara:strand:- start:4043 stop:5698 length:1656 start_codon:yes stop_codon:yes gene_type:complete
MALANAHIKNVNYEHVEIIIRDDFTGAIIGNKIFFEKPSALSLQTARAWVEERYSADNITITTEGFESPLSSKAVNDEGIVVQKPAPSMSQPETFEDFLSQYSVPTNTGEEVESAVDSYMSFMSEQNMSLPPTNSDEANYMSMEPEQATGISDDEKIQSLPEDDQTDLLNVKSFHEIYDRYSTDGDSTSQVDGEVSDAYTPAHQRVFRDMNNTDGQLDRINKKSVYDNPKIPKTRKPAISLAGSNKDDKAKVSKSINSKQSLEKKGVAGDVLDEPVPAYNRAKYDNIIQNKNNASIVFTRDRNTNLLSGYGGKGNTGAGAIDIVCGRMGNDPKKLNDKNKAVQVNPFFVPTETDMGTFVDSARIYISQKADIDDYFKLVDGRVGKSVERSAICIKSDAVRLVGNEGIKLVTKSDPVNSKGGRIKKNRGVDIIANNNDSKLQPMVLGDNMQKCVGEMAEMINNLIGALQATINNVAQLDVALASHVHISPFFGAPTLPSPNGAPMCIASLIELVSVESFSSAAQKWNVNTFKWKYLKQGSPLTIRSKYNNVN